MATPALTDKQKDDTITELAMLLRRVSRDLNRADPGNTKASGALDYLHRKGFTGLRPLERAVRVDP